MKTATLELTTDELLTLSAALEVFADSGEYDESAAEMEKRVHQALRLM